MPSWRGPLKRVTGELTGSGGPSSRVIRALDVPGADDRVLGQRLRASAGVASSSCAGRQIGRPLVLNLPSRSKSSTTCCSAGGTLPSTAFRSARPRKSIGANVGAAASAA